MLATAAGQLLFYRMLRLYGVAQTTLVAYLIPVAGLVIGAVVLGETVTGAKLAGLIVILLAVATASGTLRPPGDMRTFRRWRSPTPPHSDELPCAMRSQ